MLYILRQQLTESKICYKKICCKKNITMEILHKQEYCHGFGVPTFVVCILVLCLPFLLIIIGNL